jgi:spermidine synthase
VITIPVRSDKLAMRVAVSETLHSERTQFQQVDIIDTVAFGKMLLLDGHIQLATLDEFAYHESLVQIPLLNVPHPKRALVIGGGDGGVIREIARHASIEHIDMVEIDQGVIDACRRHLPELSAGAFDDPRVHVHVRDAFPFVKQDLEPYDLIVMDSTDVYEEEDGGLSEQLWTAEFYQDIVRLLSPTGMVVTQADNLVFCPYSMEGILETYRSLFPVAGSYWALVPSFGGFSGFVFGSKGIEPAKELPSSSLEFRYLTARTYGLAFDATLFI